MMSDSKRLELRESYIQGWDDMDLERLLATTAPNFFFDDPVQPKAVDHTALVSHMQRWNARMRALGGNNEWQLTHRLRDDAGSILTDWEWWQVIGTETQGAVPILTIDDRVLLERITYFDRSQ